MTREQIIAGLECLSHHICPDCPNFLKRENCPDGEDKTVEIARAALELLKAQEPVAPQDHDPVLYGHRFLCGQCHHKIWRNNNYCSNCGRAVTWE